MGSHSLCDMHFKIGVHALISVHLLGNIEAFLIQRPLPELLQTVSRHTYTHTSYMDSQGCSSLSRSLPSQINLAKCCGWDCQLFWSGQCPKTGSC